MKKCAKCGTSNPGYDGNVQCPKGGLHQWVEEGPKKAEGCDCADKTCREGCSEDHTHKIFLCDKCHLDAYQKEADERPSGHKLWLDELYGLYEQGRKEGVPQNYLDYFKVQTFILHKIEESLRRAAERVKGLRIYNKNPSTSDQTCPMCQYENDYSLFPIKTCMCTYNNALDEAAESIIKDNE